jgi:hypothetical protein
MSEIPYFPFIMFKFLKDLHTRKYSDIYLSQYLDGKVSMPAYTQSVYLSIILIRRLSLE